LQDIAEVERILPDHQGAEGILMTTQLQLGDIAIEWLASAARTLDLLTKEVAKQCKQPLSRCVAWA